MTNEVYENAVLYFPLTMEKAIEWRINDAYSIVITLDDGGTYIYDDVGHSMRRLPSKDEMTEELYKKEFGRRLRRVMFLKSITQDELSDMTGITRVMINRYVNGKSIPSLYTVDRLAEALNCSVDELRCTY